VKDRTRKTSLLHSFAAYTLIYFQTPTEVLADDNVLYGAPLLFQHSGIKAQLHITQLQWLGFPYKRNAKGTEMKEYINSLTDM